jgi:hypothetical protein
VGAALGLPSVLWGVYGRGATKQAGTHRASYCPFRSARPAVPVLPGDDVDELPVRYAMGVDTYVFKMPVPLDTRKERSFELTLVSQEDAVVVHSTAAFGRRPSAQGAVDASDRQRDTYPVPPLHCRQAHAYFSDSAA